MRDTLRFQAKSGKASGSVPYGYAIVGKKKSKAFVTVPEKARYVVIIFTMFADGYGGHRIAIALNAMRDEKGNLIPSPRGKKWEIGTVNAILRNPTYRGVYVYGKTRRATGRELNEDGKGIGQGSQDG